MARRINRTRWCASQVLAWIIRQQPLTLEKNEWTSDMGPALKDAQKKLAAAIATGQVEAWGRKQPHSLAERIPNDPFRILGLTVVVGPYGEVTTLDPQRPYDGPHWSSIEFDAEEIKRAFPQPAPLAAALDWMRREAQRHAASGYIEKRDVIVADCMKATDCTKRVAEAAHKSLPERLKRKRGKSPKKIG